METNPNISTDVQPERLKNLLKALVDIYSPSGKEEGIVEYVESYLKNNGLDVIRQKVDENRFNLVVLPKNEEEVDLCFVGHLDTVTAHDLENYGFSEEGDTVSGLGTADMKAGCAAMIEAFTAPKEAYLLLKCGFVASFVTGSNNPWTLFSDVRNASFAASVLSIQSSFKVCLCGSRTRIS